MYLGYLCLLLFASVSSNFEGFVVSALFLVGKFCVQMYIVTICHCVSGWHGDSLSFKSKWVLKCYCSIQY